MLNLRVDDTISESYLSVSPAKRGKRQIMIGHGSFTYWHGGEVETRESAKLLCAGPIPARTSQ